MKLNDKLAELFRLASAPVVQPVPTGWYSSQQLADQWECSLTKAQRAVRKLLSLKKLERKTFVVETGGRTYSVPHFRAV
jgi:predicted transcriptional regulator